VTDKVQAGGSQCSSDTIDICTCICTKGLQSVARSSTSCSGTGVTCTYRYEYRAGVAAACGLWWTVQVVNTPAAAFSWLHSWQKALVRRRAACQLLYTPLHVTARYYVATQAVALHPV
jgi:hypothetical protein